MSYASLCRSRILTKLEAKIGRPDDYLNLVLDLIVALTQLPDVPVFCLELSLIGRRKVGFDVTQPLHSCVGLD